MHFAWLLRQPRSSMAGAVRLSRSTRESLYTNLFELMLSANRPVTQVYSCSFVVEAVTVTPKHDGHSQDLYAHS